MPGWHKPFSCNKAKIGNAELAPSPSRVERKCMSRSSQPVHTPVTNCGVMPINQPSELFWVVPVLPAMGLVKPIFISQPRSGTIFNYAFQHIGHYISGLRIHGLHHFRGMGINHVAIFIFNTQYISWLGPGTMVGKYRVSAVISNTEALNTPRHIDGYGGTSLVMPIFFISSITGMGLTSFIT